MLVTLFGSSRLRAAHEISFSYRDSAAYQEGLQERIAADFPLYPLELRDPDSSLTGGGGAARLAAILWRVVIYYPSYFAQAVKFYRLLRRLRPDVLHVNNGGYPGALSCRAMALAGRVAGVRGSLMVVNNLAVPYGRPARWLDYPMDRLVAAVVDRFVTGSEAAALQLRSVMRLPTSKSIAIHNGIRERPVLSSPTEVRRRLGVGGFDGTLFGVVALLEPRKGHAVLIDAVSRLVGQAGAPTVMVLVEGHGPLANELAELVRTRGLGDVIRFVGDEARIFDFMAALDVLILPSVRDEDFPNVIIESMSLARPVIASRLAGTPEQVDDNVTGLLVEPGDAEVLAGAMHALARDPERRRRMGEAARATFEAKFASEVAVARYMELYSQMTNEGAAG